MFDVIVVVSEGVVPSVGRNLVGPRENRALVDCSERMCGRRGDNEFVRTMKCVLNGLIHENNNFLNSNHRLRQFILKAIGHTDKRTDRPSYKDPKTHTKPGKTK